MSGWWKNWGLVGGIVVFAAALSSLDGAPAEDWLHGFLAYATLLGLGVLSLKQADNLFLPSPQARRLAWLACLLRLIVGVGMMLVLPVYGYSTSEVTEAGYFYRDTFTRDQMAWQIVSQDLPIGDAFLGIYPGDQYGGLLALSAAVYKLLSPDVHRPFLILILTAAASGWGVLAMWAATRWGLRITPKIDEQQSGDDMVDRAALWAAAVFAFFPEGVILGATHMREAFVIPSLTVALSGVLMQIASGKFRQGLGFVVGGLGITFYFQPSLALAGLISLEGIYLLNEFSRRGKIDWRKVLLISVVGMILLSVVAAAWSRLSLGNGEGPIAVLGDWLFFNLRKETLRGGSEQVRELLGSAPLALRSLVLSIYGLLQPLLPAALFGEGIIFWRLSGSLRAAGWYFLAPLNLYALWKSFVSSNQENALTLRWMVVWTWGWSWFSSLRAGGDQWDNPRYRAVFLGMQALLAGWILARHSGAAGLRRIILFESIMVTVFGYWYLGRYHLPELISGFSFPDALVSTIAIGSTLVLLDMFLTMFITKRVKLVK